MEKETKELFRKKVGRIVERLRLEKGLSRKELGLKLGYKENTAVQAVSRFENGRAGIPKAKIEKLISLLGMKNSDFGLESTKSLKSFIAASGFLGFPVNPFGKAMVDYMDNREAEVVKAAVSDDSEEDDSEDDGDSDEGNLDYFSVARLMKLYRAGRGKAEYPLLAALEIIDYFSGADETVFADTLATLGISADEAYNTLESELMNQLKQSGPGQKNG